MALALLGAGLLLLALAVRCGGPGTVAVRPPDAPGVTATCRTLHAVLPDQVNAGDRRRTTPESARTAAWGQPAVVLRCGVPRPAGLTATSEVVEVDGVGWFLTERPRAYVFTTVGRTAYVEVRVPASIPREQATAPLVDVATALERSVPRV
ncbi:MAG TPA: DUF3515 domain-containing protein [Actinomycetes bacterium]